MKWRKAPTHKLVPVGEVQRLTGFSPEEVLLQRDTQRLVQIGEDGARHEVVRVPLELLSEEATVEGDGQRG